MQMTVNEMSVNLFKVFFYCFFSEINHMICFLLTLDTIMVFCRNPRFHSGKKVKVFGCFLVIGALHTTSQPLAEEPAVNKVEAYYTFSCLPDGDLQSSFDDDQPLICIPHIQSEAAVIRLHASSVNIFSSTPFRNLNLSSGTTIGWL